MRLANIVLIHIAVAAIEVRVLAVLIGLVRTLRRRRNLVTSRFGWIELALVPESLLLGVLGYRAHLAALRSTATPTDIVAAVAGATLTVLCLALLLWTLASWRGLFTGHAIARGQQLVTHGAFRLVRHPVYLGVILAWVGSALAFRSWIMGAIAILYVIPGYVLYARSEERMMLAVFGDEYERYRQRTSMLVPSIDNLAPLRPPS